MNSKKKCFVIMPFSETDSAVEEKWTEIFEHIIKPAVEDCGLGHECGRYEFRRANIIKDILQELNSAHVVIADLTDNNPNVLWELGVRHTLKRRTILIAQNRKFLPSDLKDYPIITYKYEQTPTEAHKFRQEIKDKLKDIEADPEKPDSPIADFLGLKNIDILAYDKKANLKKLSALLSELSYNIDAVDNILGTVKRSEERRAKEKAGFVSHVRFDNACLELLLSTTYVTLSQQLLEDVKRTNDKIRISNSRLDLWPQTGYDQEVEKILKEQLPRLKELLVSVLKKIGKIRIDYSNDNYLEPETPIMLLSSPGHEELLKAT